MPLNLKIYEPKEKEEKIKEYFLKLKAVDNGIDFCVCTKEGFTIQRLFRLGKDGKLYRQGDIDTQLAYDIGIILVENAKIKVW